ncbi:MAG: RelA/SpoT family protein [bacterium]
MDEAIALRADLESLKRPGRDGALIDRAFEYSFERHGDQTRRSGEPFMSHCVEVAKTLSDLNLDSVTIAAGLLHDVSEDCGVTNAEIERRFGSEIAYLVNAVTKISELKFESPEKQQAENWRKMLISMAQDIRVILIKLADRLHNMRTLQYLSPEKQQRIAQETQEIYAPIAHRLGIARIRWELEDLSLKYLDPPAYRSLVEKVSLKRTEREKYIEEVTGPLSAKLEENGIRAELVGRPKSFASIYRKMKKRQKEFEEIHDLFGIRVVTDSEKDCYHILGLIHTLFTPVHDRIKDYIATPKSNMYQSLHTTVIGPNGDMVEFQIRTRDMNRTAEHGIAAHWKYKEGNVTDKELEEQMRWLRQILEWQEDLTDPRDFMQSLKGDLFQHEVFVFTPKGDLKKLPSGSTPLDFAFLVHTQVGNHCVGAKVNGKIVQLRHELKSGDTVEILTNPSSEPHRDWLKIVKTAGARTKIRHYVKAKAFDQSVVLGRDMLDRELKRERIKEKDEKRLTDLAQATGHPDLDHLFAAVGRGDASIRHVINKLKEDDAGEEKPPDKILSLDRFMKLARRSVRGVKIQGVDNLMIRFARCCQPVPGDRISGLITRGSGVSVHRADCPNTLRTDVEPERRVAVEWDVEPTQSFPVHVRLLGDDRPGLLADVASVLTKMETNIKTLEITSDAGEARGSFIIDVKNLSHLQKVIKAIERIRGVRLVGRKEAAST